MEKKSSLNNGIQHLILLVTILLVFIFTLLVERNFNENYNNLEFSSSMRGVNYEVSLVNKEDPAEFCLTEGQTNDLLIIGIDYFYITQGDQLIHSVVIDNSQFEIHQELSGCWNVVREKDNLTMRIINFSDVDVLFKTRNSELETHYTDMYRQIVIYFLITRIAVVIAMMITLVFTLRDMLGE